MYWLISRADEASPTESPCVPLVTHFKRSLPVQPDSVQKPVPVVQAAAPALAAPEYPLEQEGDAHVVVDEPPETAPHW